MYNTKNGSYKNRKNRNNVHGEEQDLTGDRGASGNYLVDALLYRRHNLLGQLPPAGVLLRCDGEMCDERARVEGQVCQDLLVVAQNLGLLCCHLRPLAAPLFN